MKENQKGNWNISNCCDFANKIVINLDFGKPITQEQAKNLKKYFEYLYNPQEQKFVIKFLGRAFEKALCDKCHLKFANRYREQTLLAKKIENKKDKELENAYREAYSNGSRLKFFEEWQVDEAICYLPKIDTKTLVEELQKRTKNGEIKFIAENSGDIEVRDKKTGKTITYL